MCPRRIHEACPWIPRLVLFAATILLVEGLNLESIGRSSEPSPVPAIRRVAPVEQTSQTDVSEPSDSSLRSLSDRSSNEAMQSEYAEPLIKRIQQIDAKVASEDEVTPPDLASQWIRRHGRTQHVLGTSRVWQIADYRWTASAVSYHPLYFEDVNLERSGFSHACLQPAYSYAHFFGNALLLPYHFVETPYCECVYSLGSPRPGDCNPYRRERLFPLDVNASAAEAAAIAAAILIIP